MIVALSSGNEVTTLLAPYGASCRAATPQRLDVLVDAVVADLHDVGCVSGCDAVRVVVVDSAGRTVSDTWR